MASQSREPALERGLFDAGMAAIVVPANAEVARAWREGGVGGDPRGGCVGAAEATNSVFREQLASMGVPRIDVSGEGALLERALSALSAERVVKPTGRRIPLSPRCMRSTA